MSHILLIKALVQLAVHVVPFSAGRPHHMCSHVDWVLVYLFIFCDTVSCCVNRVIVVHALLSIALFACAAILMRSFGRWMAWIPVCRQSSMAPSP